VESIFHKKVKKPRIIENQPLEAKIERAGQLKKHISELDFTEDPKKLIEMKNSTKLTAHVNVVQY
jgi:hypothetical protein